MTVGIFVRRPSWLPLVQALRFDFICPAWRSSHGNAWRNASTRKLAERCPGSIPFDWLVKPENWYRGFRDAVKAAADSGASGYMLNIEREAFGLSIEASRFAKHAREVTEDHGLRLVISSYARPPRALPLRPFLTPGVISSPQAYDRDGAYVDGYGKSAVKAWRPPGLVLLGRGAFVLEDGKARWRTPEEIARHRQATAVDCAGEIFWPAHGVMPDRVLRALTP